ncbi:MAG: phosphoribosylanthranilate isomerase [Candidatus Synoicihabitans palmerolidicus]|nr:phosphoribosylanthranilate isomerase [Candidatus Synoicihabitans palmerolidicus]
MIDGIRLKFCGLTTLVDVEMADRLGVDFLGFILYAKSPRYLSLRQYVDMSPRLPDGRKRVAVMVEPTEAELAEVQAAGFARFQVHHRWEVEAEVLKGWSEQVGRDRLWLAPKLPPERDLPSAVLDATATVLADTYHRGGFGGSGRTGDWARFARLQRENPEHLWILAGGLTPGNVGSVLDQSEAKFIDVSSGIEAAPGIKDHGKMKALVLAVHRARTGEVK